MIVTCEACFTTFNLNDELIKPTGSKVQCSKCNKVFKVFPTVSEDISPPLTTELDDKIPDVSISQPSSLDDPGIEAPEQSSEPTALSMDFDNFAEFDFSELDKLLPEDNNEKSDKQAEPVYEFSLDVTEIKGDPDELSPGLETPVLSQTEGSPFRFEETDTISDFSEPNPQTLSLDDFEKSLEMDFSDISLVSSTESETATDPKKGGVDSEITFDQASEDAALTEDKRIGFTDIETLDLSDIESLIEKQEITSIALNEGQENFQRNDSVFVPPPTLTSGTDGLLEMEDQYLRFDELQLDKDHLNSATLQEIKESSPPQLSEVSKPAADASSQPGPVSLKTMSKDEETDFAIDKDADIVEEMADMGPAPKKGVNPVILIALVLTVIAALVYGGYMLLNSMGISIPFISNTAPSKLSDPGNLRIKSFDINSKFVDNNKIGKIFVITGKIKNEYPMARASVQITGKLYTKDKALAKTETVFCGNVLSDFDLVHADAAIFRQRLQNRPGDNRINEKILPGDAIPFMVVFFNLPENLEEFTTEIISSVAL